MKTFCSALVSLVSAALFVQALPTHRDPSTPPLTATDVVLFSTFIYKCIFDGHLNPVIPT